MSNPTKKKPYLADPNYYRLGYQLAAQLLNQRLDSRPHSARNDLAQQVRSRPPSDPATVATTLRDDADATLTWFRSRPKKNRLWVPWANPLEPHERRLMEFLEQTVAPCSRLVRAAALAKDGEDEVAKREVEAVVAAADAGKVSYRTHYALACWYARPGNGLQGDAIEHLLIALERAPKGSNHDLTEWSVRDPALASLRKDSEWFLRQIEPFRRPKTLQQSAGDPLPKELQRQLRTGPSETFAVLASAFAGPEATNGHGRNGESPTEDVLRTVVAFLNTQGGTLLIGAVDNDDRGRWADVDLGHAETIDNWVLVGVDHEINAGWEQYSKALRDIITDRIEPEARRKVQIARHSAGEGTLTCVKVQKKSDPRHYLRPSDGGDVGAPEIWARVGPSNRLLLGAEIDAFFEPGAVPTDGAN